MFEQPWNHKSIQAEPGLLFVPDSDLQVEPAPGLHVGRPHLKCGREAGLSVTVDLLLLQI